MNTKLALLGGALLVLSACASTPQEVAKPEPVKEQVPPPVFSEPVPVAPVVQEPIAPVVVEQGPAAGSVAHFKYMSGDDRVYFGYDQVSLDNQTRDILRRQAEWLNQYTSSIIVIGGNADERGTREYNLALGARRAESVKAFFVSQGVNPSRITTVSYGKERPIDGGSNEGAWRLNRNAHTAVLVGGNS